MSMVLFASLFRELALRETRSITLPPEPASIFRLPPDEYGFLELYCVERGCDCRRVIINVVSRQTSKHLATINHAFEPPAPDAHVPEQTFLDPINRQSRWSDSLLELFLHVLEIDPSYARRLEQHYQIVKDALADPDHPIHLLAHVREVEEERSQYDSTLQPVRRSAIPRREQSSIGNRKPGRNDPCPCGSGKKYKKCCLRLE